MIFLYLLRWSCGFFPFQLTDVFSNINTNLHTWAKPTWSWWIIYLICCQIWFAKILFSYFISMSTRDISLTSNENSAVILRFVPFYLTYLWLPLRFFYHWFEQFYFDMLWCFLFLVLEVCSASWICVCRVYIKFGRILVNMFFIHSSVLFFGDSNFVCFKPLAVVSQVTNALFSLLEDSFFFCSYFILILLQCLQIH